MGPFALVLGVAQDGGHPQAGCRGSCCRSEPQQRHRPTCVALVAGGRAWLLDATPALPAQLEDLLARDIELAGILLTHAHIGHYAGLVHLGREVMDTDALPVWAMPEMRRFLEANGPWEQLVRIGNIRIEELAPGRAVKLAARLTVTPFLIPHRAEYAETVGFRVAGPSRSLLYIPDTDSWEDWDPPVETFIDQCDVALLDATFYDRDELPGRDMAETNHPSATDSMARFAASGVDRRRIRFIHMNHTNPMLDADSAAYSRVIESGMGVAAEGDEYAL